MVLLVCKTVSYFRNQINVPLNNDSLDLEHIQLTGGEKHFTSNTWECRNQAVVPIDQLYPKALLLSCFAKSTRRRNYIPENLPCSLTL